MTATTTESTRTSTTTASTTTSFVQRLGRWNSGILSSGSSIQKNTFRRSSSKTNLRVRFAPDPTTSSSNNSTTTGVQCQVIVLPKIPKDVKKSDLYVTPEEKIGSTDDADEVVYKYKEGRQSQYRPYHHQLAALWDACVSTKDETAGVDHVVALAASKCPPVVVASLDLKTMANASIRGMERKLLVSSSSSSSSSSDHDHANKLLSKEVFVQKILEAQTTYKRVPMMSAEHRAKLLRTKSKKYSLPHRWLAAALAAGDEQVAHAIYAKANMLDATKNSSSSGMNNTVAAVSA